jgi:hypothetical protein
MIFLMKKKQLRLMWLKSQTQQKQTNSTSFTACLQTQSFVLNLRL